MSDTRGDGSYFWWCAHVMENPFLLCKRTQQVVEVTEVCTHAPEVEVKYLPDGPTGFIQIIDVEVLSEMEVLAWASR